MRKNKVRRGFVAIVLVVVALFFIAGTYARYSTSASANAVVDVAKWAVKIKHDDTELSSVSQNVTFAIDSNDYVVSNKMAPATRATATFELDLTGTEVAVDFDAVIDASGLADVIRANNQITTSVTMDGVTYTSGSTVTIPLPTNGGAFTAENGKKTFVLAIEWQNDDTNNVNDTNIGVTEGATFSIPVTFTAQQHIATANP